ncbi:MAG: hypothetical protein AAFW98_09885, partial [Pseudomonadota bacterium]
AGLIWLAVMSAPWRLAGIGVVLVALALAPSAERFDLVVVEDGSGVAARGPSGDLILAAGTKDFPASLILKAGGDARLPREAKAGACDAYGCTLPLAAGVVALPNSPRAALEDCRRAAAVVTRGFVRGCAAPLVVDRGLLQQMGSLSARFEDGTWQVKHAMPQGMTRPFHVRPTITYD